MPPTAQPISYAEPALPRRWFSVRTAVVTLFVTLFVQTAFMLPVWTGLKTVFNDFHMKLPAFTMLYLDLADLWNFHFGWAAGWLTAVAVPVAVTVLRPPPRPPGPGEGRVKTLLAAVVVLLALNVIIVVTAVAVIVPVFTLIEGISGSAGGK